MYIMFNSTKKDGNTSLNYGEQTEVINNRKKFFKNNNIKYKNTLVIRVVNNNKITEIDKSYLEKHPDLSGEILETDAVITKEKNIFFYLNFGDCIPLVIYDNKQEILSLCHMGWHSVINNLHLEVVDYLLDKYNSKMENLVIELGPSIKKDSYIMKNPIQLGEKAWYNYLEKIDEENYKVDLDGYVVNSLKESGITNIKISNIDTYSNEDYYSNYEENKFNIPKGRFIVGVMLK